MERVPSSFLISFQIKKNFENPSTNGWDLACGHTHTQTDARNRLRAPHLSWIFVTTDSLRFATLHETKFRVISLATPHFWLAFK